MPIPITIEAVEKGTGFNNLLAGSPLETTRYRRVETYESTATITAKTMKAENNKKIFDRNELSNIFSRIALLHDIHGTIFIRKDIRISTIVKNVN